ncbi:MAG: sulfurtransferase TusA family protein [Pseudomonadota bacterium]
MADTQSKLDVTGYRCPVPVIRLEAALRNLPEGAQLLVFADDPIAAVDIPHACREAGHTVARLPDRGETCVFQVTRGPKAPE